MIHDHDLVEQRQDMGGKARNDVGLILDHGDGSGPRSLHHPCGYIDRTPGGPRDCPAFAASGQQEMDKGVLVGLCHIALRAQVFHDGKPRRRIAMLSPADGDEMLKRVGARGQVGIGRAVKIRIEGLFHPDGGSRPKIALDKARGLARHIANTPPFTAPEPQVMHQWVCPSLAHVGVIGQIGMGRKSRTRVETLLRPPFQVMRQSVRTAQILCIGIGIPGLVEQTGRADQPLLIQDATTAFDQL